MKAAPLKHPGPAPLYSDRREVAIFIARYIREKKREYGKDYHWRYTDVARQVRREFGSKSKSLRSLTAVVKRIMNDFGIGPPQNDLSYVRFEDVEAVVTRARQAWNSNKNPQTASSLIDSICGLGRCPFVPAEARDRLRLEMAEVFEIYLQLMVAEQGLVAARTAAVIYLVRTTRIRHRPNFAWRSAAGRKTLRSAFGKDWSEIDRRYSTRMGLIPFLRRRGYIPKVDSKAVFNLELPF